MTWTPPNPKHPPPPPGEPPLFRAAREGDHAAIRSLISAGADPNQQVDTRLDPGAMPTMATPLMVAAGSGDGATAETVWLLLSLGADPRVVTPAGSAAMFAAAGLGWNYRSGGDAERLSVLLDAGSPLEFSSHRGERLVAQTAATGDAARLRVILEHGGSANPQWSEEKRRRQTAWMSKLLDGARDTTGAVEQIRARHAAAPFHMDIPLFRAAESGSADCVQALLDHGADAKQRDSSGCTPLFYATTVPVARLLLAQGLTVEDRDHRRRTPLAADVRGSTRESVVGRFEQTRLFLELGASPSAQDENGNTVFFAAVRSWQRDVRTLEALVRAGANARHVNEAGNTAFHVGFGLNRRETERSSAAQVLGFLKQVGVDIESRNSDGATPLSAAVESGIAEDVLALCELGADPNAKATFHHCRGVCGTEGMSPLLAATDAVLECGQKAEVLLRAGADPRATDEAGHTALVLAVARLAEDSEDADATSKRFFEGLTALPLSMQTRDTVDAQRPVLREYITRFAAGIPLSREYPDVSEQWRADLLETIEVLAAYAWVQ